jgi:adenylate kinase family enzyme
MPKVELLVGMVGSGKSTYARKRADQGAMIVNHDSLTEMLHARYRYEQGKRDLYRRLEESLAFEVLARGFDVVIDRTHLTRENRSRWVKWARNYDSLNTFDGRGPTTPVIAVAFPIEDPDTHALRRYVADARGRPLHEWIQVARHHAEQARQEPLDWGTEGFAGLVTVDDILAYANAGDAP